jgi:hypothetical protein
MAELVTVYEARPNEVARIVGLLENRHLHPVIADDADRMTAYREQTHLVRIAVPVVERDMAVGVLTEAEHEDRARLSHLVKVTDGAVLFVLVVLGFVAVVGFVDAGGKWLALTWLVLCLLAAVALVRWAWARRTQD